MKRWGSRLSVQELVVFSVTASSGATAGRAVKMKLAEFEGPSCLPDACSSVPC